MNPLLLSAILIIGASGIAAQVLLLRELLISFFGNELTIGIILANWIITEAAGAFILGKFSGRIKKKLNVFVILQLLFSALLPVSLLLSRTYKGFMGIPFAEAVGLPVVFLGSFLIMLPVSFCHGALFSLACKIYNSIGKAYAWETVGAICGGIILTKLFIPLTNLFQAVFIVSLANIIICLFFFRALSKPIRFAVLSLFVLTLALAFNGGISYFNKYSIKKQWSGRKVLDYKNSVYGNIAVTNELGQYTFFYNGLPIITTPQPDRVFVQEFGNLPLSFLDDPKKILVISGGSGGLISEILKHPVEKVDYAELDPLIIEMLRKYPTALSKGELADPRVKIKNTDGRYFLRNTRNKYDVILIGLSRPSDLATNRFFTQEFFSLAKERLNPGGLVALNLAGTLTYLSRELKDLNACVLHGLNSAFNYVRVIPGDYNIFLASDSGAILEVNSGLISRRLDALKIKTDLLIPSYLDYRLDKQWELWFEKNLSGATYKVNQDLRPFAVLEALILWNKQFSRNLAGVFTALSGLTTGASALAILALTLVLGYIFSKNANKKLPIVYCIATTGFFGMLANLVLIFSFQVNYGYLYNMIGILISILMSGIAAGSIFMERIADKIKNDFGLFARLETLAAVFSLGLAVALDHFSGYALYILLFFLTGLLMGLEFPLASKIYIGKGGELGSTAGLLYSADLLGGWCAGIAGGIVLLPVLGLFNTCLVMAMLKLSSLLLLVMVAKKV